MSADPRDPLSSTHRLAPALDSAEAISGRVQAARAALRFAERRYPTAVEYAGVAAIVYGVWQINHPAAWLTLGVLLVVEAVTTAIR